ncbi:MAG: glycosyltransferase family 39 protein [Verrucomicrobiota bacterium]|jgi:hypothetical protein
MDTESQPVNLKKAWISEHPRIVIGVILVVCLGPFINKAIHVDDPLFVWTGQWIQKHPADFFGFKVNWWVSAVPMWVANWNPPLMSYFLAGVASLFGWHEIALHLACLLVAFMAATGIYALAKMWCERPLLATVIAIFTPVFLVSSTTLMCDVLMLTFWIWAVVLWERALASNEQSWWRFAGAGVLAGLAVLTKYSAVTMLPLLPILGILRTRKVGWWLVGLAVPLMMVAGYEWMTAEMYGRGLLSAASYHALTFRATGDWKTRGVIGLAFAGGSLLPVLLFAPWLWRQRMWLLAGGVAIFGALTGMFRLCDFEIMRAVPEQLKWIILLQLAFMTAAGLHLLLLTGVEAWQSRDIISMILAFWIMSGLLFATELNWTVSARGFLPIVPAVAILLVRRLRTTTAIFKWNGWSLWPLAPAMVIALSLAVADYRVANSARTAAEQITAKYKPANHTIWFEGHLGFQYYMEKLGGQPLDIERSTLQPGDIVVLPFNSYGQIPLPPDSVGWLRAYSCIPDSWINLSVGMVGAGGFYGSTLGPIPFGVGGIPPHTYCVVKVLSRVQFNTRPANLREVQAGALPVFTNLSFSMEDKFGFRTKSGAMGQIQLAEQSEKDGNLAAAIQHYRKALDMDSNNPVVLNNLAWILATADNPALRNGDEAVQLSARAVALTDSRLPVFIGTLAAAYAEAGQLPQAVEMAVTAHHLAVITGQKEVAAANAKLSERYAAGKTAGASIVP